MPEDEPIQEKPAGGWRARFGDLLLVQSVEPVELLVTAQGVLFPSVALLRGMDTDFQALVSDVPFLKNGRVLFGLVIALSLLRLYAILAARLSLRLWLARVFLVYWLFFACLYLVTGTAANEVGGFLGASLANFWILVRLGENLIRRKHDAKLAATPPS